MYNANTPSADELPSAAQLLRSTAIAVAAAVAILVTVVLPAEYGVDPTGAGWLLGLAEMGEIKVQLAEEAAADAHGGSSTPAPDFGEAARLDAIERQLDEIKTVLTALQAGGAIGPDAAAAPAEQPADAVVGAAPALPAGWRDEIEITLQPGEGVELKLVMAADAEAEFQWTANGGVLNFDTHGDGGGQSVSYEKGRGVPEQTGILRAAFDGNHGWFWRNRTDAPVTLTLRTRGDYSELKRTA